LDLWIDLSLEEYSLNNPTPNGANGRSPNGQFAPGNPGGPGNPFAHRVAALRSALMDAITEDDLRAIVAILIAKAREGDAVAIREVLDRTIGKPGPTQNPDRVALDEMEIELALRKAEIGSIFAGVPD
jgi:hypothetical protein